VISFYATGDVGKRQDARERIEAQVIELGRRSVSPMMGCVAARGVAFKPESGRLPITIAPTVTSNPVLITT
jgi:hypothetical protein